MITQEHILTIFPTIKKDDYRKQLVDALNEYLPKYDIKTKAQVSCFLGQCAVESGGFTVFKENLNYSAKGLCSTWPKRFPTLDSALPYERKPELIANKVYSGRNGNGDSSSGDGYKFIGRGCIQLTGRFNYESFARSIDLSIEHVIAHMETIDGAIDAGGYYWHRENLNRFIKDESHIDHEGLTRAINGGLTDLKKRIAYTQTALLTLNFDTL